ncbi:MBL fold metallo-hydrolase [Roseomonas sp. USHLN139]|uniref:MBL fold metallo-hydrolase n=1 Tax=Roseomonas sp. USHLN139 TaxID=3081298 RepID=UPI003B01DFDB
MPTYLCATCGTSFAPAAAPPRSCPICEEERQYVPAGGQAWTTTAALAAGHRNAWRRHQPGLYSLQTVPAFAINQRAFLVRTPQGHILWDCIALLDEATREIIAALGGLAGIALSHPHYYTTMQDWAAAFDVPVHLHAADRAHVVRPDDRLRFWEGDSLPLAERLTLVRAGGHYAGGTVLHWAEGEGVLLVGDIVQVTPGARGVSFQWSYPNMLPLSAARLRQLTDRLAPWRYQRIYGAFLGQEVAQGGEAMVAACAARYRRLLEAPAT